MNIRRAILAVTKVVLVGLLTAVFISGAAIIFVAGLDILGFVEVRIPLAFAALTRSTSPVSAFTAMIRSKASPRRFKERDGNS